MSTKLTQAHDSYLECGPVVKKTVFLNSRHVMDAIIISTCESAPTLEFVLEDFVPIKFIRVVLKCF